MELFERSAYMQIKVMHTIHLLDTLLHKCMCSHMYVKGLYSKMHLMNLFFFGIKKWIDLFQAACSFMLWTVLNSVHSVLPVRVVSSWSCGGEEEVGLLACADLTQAWCEGGGRGWWGWVDGWVDGCFEVVDIPLCYRILTVYRPVDGKCIFSNFGKCIFSNFVFLPFLTSCRASVLFLFCFLV